MRALFSPSMRGRAAEGGRGSLTHHLKLELGNTLEGTLHLEPYCAHQRQRVAFFNDAGMEAVIEDHAAIFKMVLEMKISGARRKGFSEFGESQIVCGNQADRLPVDQAADDRLGADSAIVRIRAVQDFVQKKEHRHLFRKLHDVVQTLNLSIETRGSLLQRIHHANGRANGQNRNQHALRAHGRSRESKGGIDSDSPEQRALTRHIRTTDDEDLPVAIERYGIRNALRKRQKRMPQVFTVKLRSGGDNLRKRILRMLIRISGEGT